MCVIQRERFHGVSRHAVVHAQRIELVLASLAHAKVCLWVGVHVCLRLSLWVWVGGCVGVCLYVGVGVPVGSWSWRRPFTTMTSITMRGCWACTMRLS
jgi:hypothetical protein